MNIAYIYIVELYWRKMNNEHSWLKILTHIFPLSLAAAFILFWWIVFVPWANRFFYAYKNTKYALIECIELFWYHALESHWIAYHIVSWIQLNGEWFFSFFLFYSSFARSTFCATGTVNRNKYCERLTTKKSTECYFIRLFSEFFTNLSRKYSFWCWNQFLAKQRALTMATHRHKNSQCLKWNWRQNKNKNA